MPSVFLPPLLAVAAAAFGYWLAWLSAARDTRTALACVGGVTLFFGGLLAFGPTPTPGAVALPGASVMLGALVGALLRVRHGAA